MTDKNYCMSSFLIFRCVADPSKEFGDELHHQICPPPSYRYPCKTSEDIRDVIQTYLKDKVDEETGLMLSGGIDSAILAAFLPEGTKAYTLNCVADGAFNEVERAKKCAEKNKLDHRVVNVTWEDYQEFVPLLMERKGAPLHSIEPQIYKAALQAKKDGIKRLVFGESADVIFGGMDGLLAKDWTMEEFVRRYQYVDPKVVLKHPVEITEPFELYRTAEGIDAHKFVSEFFYTEGRGSYINATGLAGVEFVAPYSQMILDGPIDLKRIRSGDSKYLVRQLFHSIYPDWEPPVKTPMPRAVTQWLADWGGPVRPEFIPGCTEGMKGDQKWLVYCLEWFLNQFGL
jgi:hypothetical protein